MFSSHRDFAYIHTAVYVGKVMGRHYVIENAGSGEKKREGAWLRLTGTGKLGNLSVL